MSFLKRRTFRARPIPELLDGGDWEVRNSNNVKMAYVDFATRQFVVPFEESPAGELVRAHEAMHVKITPKDFKLPEEMDFVTLQSVEDCRVWQGLRICGIKTDNPKARVYSDKELEKGFSGEKMQHPLKHAEALIATKGMNEESKVRELANLKCVEIVDELVEKYFAGDERNGDITSFEDAMTCGKELREKIIEAFPENPPPPPQGGKGKGNPGEEGDQNGNLTFSWLMEGDESENQTGLEALTEEEIREAGELGIANAFESRDNFTYRENFAPPGKLKMEYPRLDHAIKFKTTDSVKLTPSEEGTVPTRMHRYATDMHLFNRKGKRRAGAAILIDVSGSMGLDNDQVLKIIKQCPSSIIGIYSGNSDSGVLRIIAENSKYSTVLRTGMGGGNIVDIPAIEWLAKRKEKKKLWISDGWITTAHESMAYEEDIRKLSNTLRVNRIERVGGVKELILSGKLIDHAFDDGHTLGRS